MCLTEPGARVTSTSLMGHSPVEIPRSPGRISDNRGSDINKRRAALMIAWPCEKRVRTDAHGETVTVARRLRTDRRSRRSYSTRVSRARETVIGVALRGKQSRETAIAGQTEIGRTRENEKEPRPAHLATYRDSGNAHFTRCTKRAV